MKMPRFWKRHAIIKPSNPTRRMVVQLGPLPGARLGPAKNHLSVTAFQDDGESISFPHLPGHYGPKKTLYGGISLPMSEMGMSKLIRYAHKCPIWG
jgi:hypothetical protein